MSFVRLDATTCPTCGLVAVPPEPIGCERCGLAADQLEPTIVSSEGVVTARATVHQHARPEPPTPFVVVEVRLDAGPVVRSLLRGPGADRVEIDQRVGGKLADGRFAFVLPDEARP